MKQSLQLKLGQSLSMTPQLQQAIKLLQLSTMDLQLEIQQALESNPMLEMMEEGEAPDDDLPRISEEEMVRLHQDANEVTDFSEPAAHNDTRDEWQDEHIPDDLPVDSQWDDVYQTSGSTNASSGQGEDDDYSFENRNAAVDTLQDHLLWQLNLTTMTDRDRIIAMAIIDAIAPTGFLDTPIQDIFEGLLSQWSSVEESLDAAVDTDPLEMDEVMAVLHRVQQFDPPGVAAHDLRECLLIQLNQLHEDTPWLIDAKLVVSDYLGLLAAHDYKQLMRKSDIRENTLKKVIELIQSLTPQPGARIEPEKTEYVVPDVYVSKKRNRWVVELNPDIAPRLRINADYASLVRRADSSADNTFLKDHLQEARWFLKSLESRNETLMKVATAIVEHQRGFLEYGEEAMKPLVLADIAEMVGMHESTISRVTTQKYMHTPQGVYELKFFFSSHVGTAGGGECSSTAVRTMIRKLIAEESPRKPLSDSALADILDKQGINVARRTVAKYRESLNIPPSNERKRLS
ncbi:MAG TPA: RNA polymerase factor sigma-54 [Pseudomonadales bacterium]|nr:RNA polymerase factor sigma-54 [Pseudomonadales bacterium]